MVQASPHNQVFKGPSGSHGRMKEARTTGFVQRFFNRSTLDNTMQYDRQRESLSLYNVLAVGYLHPSPPTIEQYLLLRPFPHTIRL